MQSNGGVAAFVLGLLIAVFACATPESVYWIAPGHQGAPGVDNIMVLPLNLTFAMPTEIEGASGRVFAELGRYFAARQRQAVTVSVIDANRLWAASIVEVEASAPETRGYEAAMSVLARRLGASGDFDAIVVPDLVFRDARLSRRTAEWDGVKRTFRMVNAPSSLDDSVIRTMSFGGSTSGVSVRVRVYTPTGTSVFEGYGGIDLIHQVNLADMTRKRRYQVEVRPDLLEDVELIRNAIAQAFLPYFEIPESSAW